MEKRDVLELKKRLKIDKASFDRISGCYVSTEKEKILTFNKSFLGLEEEEQHKYLDIAKKVLSNKIGDQFIEHEFPVAVANSTRDDLLKLSKEGINDESFMERFYDHIIDTYDSLDAYVILVFHDRYDIPNKNTDNLYDDTSDEVYNYILCAICPVKASKSGLAYFEKENEINVRLQDKILEAPVNGFLYPAYTDRSSDIHAIMFYTKTPKTPASNFWQAAFSVTPNQTATEKRIKFEDTIEPAIANDDTTYIEVQQAFSNYIEEKKANKDDNPSVLTKDTLKEILLENEVNENKTEEITEQFTKSFSDEEVTVEELMDASALKNAALILENKQLKIENQKLRDQLKELGA
ncbi:protein of unknown function [Lachnospiraceae bacterium KHCPX20]|nr:protein of unknown function [Lachnospiraceae bacterium KHCPX20]